jgi:ligand-binding SRPBCC domain-containing protein
MTARALDEASTHSARANNAAVQHRSLGRGLHQLETVAFFPVPVDTVFPFFCDVHNLERITPPELAFRVLTPGPVEINRGTLIDYRLGLFGVPFGWRTMIAEWDPPHVFVDEQLRGPYHTWIHRHTFEAVDGGTRMTDRVDYRLPLHPLSGPALPLVRRQLNRIFAFRREVIGGLFRAV